MTKKGFSFFSRKKVTPSAAAPGDTKVSDATAKHAQIDYFLCGGTS